MEDLKKIQEFFSKPLEEVTKSQMLKKAKKGSYPATLVAIENGKVVAQEKVSTPQEAPAAHSVMSKKYPNANIRLEDSTGKILEENAFVEAFKFEKALKGMGYDVKVKYLDDFGKDVFEIYFNNPADADESIFYDAKKLGYDNVRVFANPNESVNEAKKLTYNDFVRMVRDDMNAGSSSDESVSDEQVKKVAKRKYNEYLQGVNIDDLFEYNSGIYYNPDESSPHPKAKEASKSGIEKVKDMLKKIMKEDMSLDDQAKAYFLAKVKKGEIDTLPDNPKAAFLAQMMKNQMGEGLSDYEEEEANYDELYSDYKYKVDEAKPKKGHGEKISKEVFSKLKGKTINYKGADYKVVDSDEAVLTLKDEDGKSKTINLRQFNVSGMIDEIMETIELGKNLNEELCPKGKAYIKKRQAAGEKSSAYLSGRAVKVCKGQMKG